MQNFFIDTLNTNLQIHSNIGAVQFFLQTPVEGLDFPDLRFQSYDKPGEDGGQVSSSYYSGRSVILRGIFQGSTAAQYEANRNLLVQALAVRRSTTGVPQPVRCSLTTVGGSNLFFDGFISRKPVFNWDEIKWGKFLIQLYVPGPYLLSGSLQTTSQLYVASSGGTVLPWTLPVTLAVSTGGSSNVLNNGNGTALPIMRLTGLLTNPQVINNASGLSMKLNYTVPNGSYVDVDMANKLILLNGTSPILSVKADGSDWWGLDPGTTLIRLLTDSSADSGYVQFLYYHSYAGV
jgi:hypothetical protein